MTFWSRASIVIDFFRDLVYDTKDEGKFTNSSFNTRKFVIFLAVVMLICLNSLAWHRSRMLATQVIMYQKHLAVNHCPPLSLKDSDK